MMNNLSLEKFQNGVQIYQDNDKYKFTKDAIDLAKFCNIKSSDNVLELCAGSGVISFYSYSVKKYNFLYLNELQKEMCEIIRKNIEINNMQEKAICFNCDLKELKISDFSKKLDIIICNPPYFKFNGEKINEDYSKAISRHEITTNLEEIIRKSSELIKDRGKFYIEISAERSCELISLLTKYKFECKRIKFIVGKYDFAKLILIEAVFKAQSGVKIMIEKD